MCVKIRYHFANIHSQCKSIFPKLVQFQLKANIKTVSNEQKKNINKIKTVREQK